MLSEIEKINKEIDAFKVGNKAELEHFRIAFLGRKGHIKSLMNDFKSLPPEEKQRYGKDINALQKKAQERLATLSQELEKQNTSSDTGIYGDLTREALTAPLGARHPINLVKNRIIEIFSQIGFGLSEGPEMEDDWHNFTALNLSEHHPARDMQDTFFLEQDLSYLLRTHTSSVQIRHIEQHEPPIRVLCPGRVYRNEDVSSRANCFFYQIEGLYIDKKVSFADLKQTLSYFTKALFGTSKIRLRPSYFPFTEPSAEVDVYWGLETEADHTITKGTGWLEIMGCGMVDPNVLENTKIDPDKYSGYAFGMGIDRIAMLRYQINDIRTLFQNDVRFLAQFRSQ